MDRQKVLIPFYGWCYLVMRAEVLGSLEYQYEETNYDCGYDIYSNDDGDYFAVKEDEYV